MSTQNTTLSESTKQLHQSKLLKLSELGITDFTDTEKVITTIKSISTNLNTQKVYTQAVLSSLPDNKVYKQQVKLLSSTIQSQENENKLTDKQKATFIPWEEILEIRDNYKTTITQNSKYVKKTPYKNLLLLSIYTYIPPRRIEDYVKMYSFINRPDQLDTSINYYIQSERIFIFNTYKTSSNYGTQEIHLPDELYNIIDEYIRVYKITDESSLLNYSRGQNLSDAIGDLFTKLVNKRVTVDTIRHAFSTYQHNKMPTVADRIDYTEKMGHSIIQDLKYVKYTE